MNIKTHSGRCRIRTAILASAICAIICIGCQKQSATNDTETSQKEAASQTDEQVVEEMSETSLFDGESLAGWLQTDFGGQVEAKVVDGEIVLDMGSPLAGINRNRDEKLPTSNYEISLEAKRTDGIDFFCGLTFPVQESYCTLIVAGWAGATVGLSCVDGLDASSNDTSCVMDLKDHRWYKIRLKVTDEAIVCWIDDEEVIRQELKGHEISIRPDVTACRPLGLCAFESAVAYRNIVLKQLKPASKTQVGK